MLARVVGKHCEAGDIVVKDEFLPADVQPGDLLAVPGTGAYCRSMASNYNHVPRPPVVAVGDGAGAGDRAAGDRGRPARVWMWGETWHDDGKSRYGWRCWAAAPSAAEVVRLLHEQADDLRARIGAPLELVGIAVRRLGRDRGDLPVDPALFTTDALGLVKRDDVDVVVEVIGGIEPARTWLVEALRAGKSVVTANKALLAEDGPALHDAAAEGGADLYYEAAVAGAIPLLRPLRESLHGDRITRVTGIVNGTTNFILSSDGRHRRRLRRGAGGGDRARLRRGRPDRRRRGLRRRGEGRDPGLAGLPHPGHAPPTCYREGITEVTAADVAQRQGDGLHHQAALHRVRGPTDGAVVGPGAPGDDPAHATRWPASATRSTRSSSRRRPPASSCSTAAAPAVRRPRARCSATSSRWPATGSPGCAPPSESDLRRPARSGRWVRSVTRYHVSLDVADRAGVLAAVAGVFAEHDVCIQTVRQEGRGDDATLVVVTHAATDAALAATVDELRAAGHRPGRSPA